jgi:hypothetical protein
MVLRAIPCRHDFNPAHPPPLPSLSPLYHSSRHEPNHLPPDPQQALTSQAISCDPRVMNRVQTHLKEGTAGFHLNLIDASGNLLPRKLAVTPSQITLLSPPTAGQPGVFLSGFFVLLCC